MVHQKACDVRDEGAVVVQVPLYAGQTVRVGDCPGGVEGHLDPLIYREVVCNPQVGHRVRDSYDLRDEIDGPIVIGR